MLLETWTLKIMLVRFHVRIKSIGNWAKDYCLHFVCVLIPFGKNGLTGDGLGYGDS